MAANKRVKEHNSRTT